MKYKFEYIWLDGYTPEPNLRSKTKIIESNNIESTLTDLPTWSYDGSSITLTGFNRQSDLLPSACLVEEPS